MTLIPAERINIHQTYRLTINGTIYLGMPIPGRLLDGAGTGQPGSDYVTSITWGNLAGRARQLPAMADVVNMREPRALWTV